MYMMASSWKLSDDLKCPICQDLLTNPKLLPCSHTFCEDCLSLLAPQYRGHRKHISCPVCRAEAAVPKNKVSNFPTNRIAKSLAEDLRRRSDEKARRRARDSRWTRCTLCDADDQDAATHYCQNCSEFLCNRCLQQHKKYKQNASHEVVKARDIQTGSVKMQFPCPEHPRELQQFVCITCLDRICCRCLEIEHQSDEHEVIGIAEMAERQIMEFEGLQQKIEQKSLIVQKYLSFAEEKLRKVKYTVGQRKREIRSAYDAAADHLQRRKDELFEECNNFERTLCQELEGIIECHHDCLERLSDKASVIKEEVNRLHQPDVSLSEHAARLDGTEAILRRDVLHTLLPESTYIAQRAEFLTFQLSPATNPLNLGTIYIRDGEIEEQPQGTDATSLSLVKDGKVTFASRSEEIKLPYAENQSVKSQADDHGDRAAVPNFFLKLFRRRKSKSLL